MNNEKDVKVYNIRNTPAEDHFSGSGNVWAAIKGDTVQALEYVSKYPFDHFKLPDWVHAVYLTYSTIAHPKTKIRYIYRSELERIKNAALSAGYMGGPASHVRINGEDIARQAREIIITAEKADLKRHQDKFIKEVAADDSDVFCGVCCFYEFIPNELIRKAKQ